MTVYYNEFNPETAHMLRQLIADGHVAPGDVDERPIQKVKADDLRGYTQHHFFAGIGGWSVALRLAGWPDDKPVWTGSCPCQPFSSAGRQKGKADERHLWPVWLGLIRESRPSALYGEQVASAVAHGWLDDVYEGLEAEGYAVGAAVLPASSVGAPHKRDRLWFVGHTKHNGQPAMPQSGGEGKTIQHHTQRADSSSEFAGAGESSDVANAERRRQQGQGEMGESLYPAAGKARQAGKSIDAGAGSWETGAWIGCPDGKQRLVKPGICLLADGVQFRRPILHAFGNAIVPQVAQAFIEASMQTIG